MTHRRHDSEPDVIRRLNDLMPNTARQLTEDEQRTDEQRLLESLGL